MPGGLEPRDYGAIGLGGAGLLASLGGGASGDLDDLLQRIGQHSEQVGAQGDDLLDLGTSGLQPALEFLTSITRGDAGAIGDATRPERTRVLDQYDTARKSVAQFTPRGGGQTSTIARSFTDEANTLSNIFATGRREGATALSTLGTRLAGMGINAKALEGQDLTNLVNAYLTQSAQEQQSSASFGESLGTLAGMLLFAA